MFSFITRRCRPAFAMACLSLSSLGCGGAATVDHEDNHAEHHIPAHKPAHFEDAVRQLELRHKELAEQWSNSDRETLAIRLQELRDIIGWLPELAADTDLKRKQWEHAQSLAWRLGDTCRSLSEQHAQKTNRPDARQLEHADWLIRQLRNLLVISRPATAFHLTEN